MYFRKLLFILIVFITKNSFGQVCNCNSVMNKVLYLTKSKYAGYAYKTGTKEYKRLVQEVKKKSDVTPENKCGDLIFEYLKYFADKHIWFYEQLSYDQYAKLSRTVTFSELTKKRADSWEGLWNMDDNKFTLLFIRKGNKLSGYVVDAKVKGYKKGDLKMEVYLSGTDYATSVGYERWNGVVEKQYRISRISDSVISTDIFEYKKISQDSLSAYCIRPAYNRDFRPKIAVNGKSVVLTIPSFLYSRYKEVDSLVNEFDSIIKKSDNLIIDLRDNYGGSTEVSYPVYKYLYTQPLEIFGACNLAIPEGIEAYKKSLADTLNYTKEELIFYRKLVDTFSKSIGKIICDSIEIRKFPEVLPSPKNVAIIMNEHTLSAAELFILIAQQSKKVKIFGEYSAGTVDFGASLEHNTGCKKYTLLLPMQTNTDYPLKKYDIKGIKPDVFIPETEKDWVNYIIKYYENNKYF